MNHNTRHIADLIPTNEIHSNAPKPSQVTGEPPAHNKVTVVKGKKLKQHNQDNMPKLYA